MTENKSEVGGSSASEAVVTWRTTVDAVREGRERERKAIDEIRKQTRYGSDTVEVPPGSTRLTIPFGMRYKQVPRARATLFYLNESDAFSIDMALGRVSETAIAFILHNSRDVAIKATIEWESFLVSQV